MCLERINLRDTFVSILKALGQEGPLIDFLPLPTSIIIPVRWTAVADKEAFGDGL